MNDRNVAKARKKRADLWEKTIVTSFRDLQWKNKASNFSCPPSNVELGGNIERAFGDSVALAGSQVFLLEMKSTEAAICDEWKDGEKLALSALRKKLEKNREKKFSSLLPMLMFSLRAHHFLYWSEDSSNFAPQVWPGALVISPYLSEVSQRKIGISFPELADFEGGFSFAVWDGDKGIPIAVSRAFANRIFTQEVALTSFLGPSKSNGSFYMKHHLGVSPKEMRAYLHWLLTEQDEKDLPINALLASRDGNLCRHVTHVSEIDSILQALIENDDKFTVTALNDVEKKKFDLPGFNDLPWNENFPEESLSTPPLGIN